jgi:hypothetical protein
MKTIETKKEEALAIHLAIKPNEVRLTNPNEYEFNADGGDYLVLTEIEADEKARDYILESVWAFNKSFLDSHSEAISELDDKTFSIIQERCESANKAILAMIDDVDHFVKDAIMCDGRGHFLSQYDGEENEQGEFFIYRIN